MTAKDKEGQEVAKSAPCQSSPRMRFFTEFLNSAGMTYAEAADLISYSRPGVQTWIKSDDSRLSLVQTIIEKAGYTLEITLTREEDEAINEKPISVEDFIVLDKGTYKPKRLTFLALALKRYNVSKTELAKALGMGYTAIRYHFYHDDITISLIYDIARALDMSLTFTIKKISGKEVEKGGKLTKARRYCTVAIETLNITEL